MKIKQTQLEERLYNYRKNLGNIKILENKLEQLDLQIYYNNQKSNETYDECIAGMSIHASVLSHMPRSVTNEFKSVVENAMLGYSKQRYNSFDFNTITNEICIYFKELISLKKNVEEIQNLLSSLGDKHKFVLEKYYICKIRDNQEVAIMYSEYFKKPVGEERAKQLRFEALNEMSKMIKSPV